MAGPSNIEWCQHSWNPFAGCAIVSPGCTNCYAMKMAARLDAMGKPLYKGLTKPSKAGPVWRGTIRRASDDVLLAPLRRKKPTTYFVNSMSDLFYEKFSDELIDQVFAVMVLCPQHTFQVLTKRADRMRDYFCAPKSRTRWHSISDAVAARAEQLGLERFQFTWPSPNVWLGVSAERQQEADERIPHLLQTPAAIRFVSAEPLLGPVDLRPYLHRKMFRGEVAAPAEQIAQALDWLIVGGESGPGARPMHPAWARSLREQCESAGVAFFFKQWGAWRPLHKGEPETWEGRQARRARDSITMPDGAYLELLGKKAAGRLLDGKQHNDMPGVTA